jgi:putative ATP-dependent endonuclease of OLD family
MKIEQIHFRNFRSLREVDLDDLGDLNLLVGKNSSGKSNILEGISFLFDNFSATGGSMIGLNEYLWYNKRVQDAIEFSAVVSLNDEEVEKIFPKEFLDYMVKEKEDFRTMSFSRKLTNLQGAWRTDYLRVGKLTLVLEDKQLTPQELRKVMPTKNTASLNDALSVAIISPTQIDEICTKIEERMRGRFKLISAEEGARNPTMPQRTTLVGSRLQSELWSWDQSTTDLEQEKYASVESAFSNVTNLKLDVATGQVYIKKPKRIPIAFEGGGVQALLSIIFSLAAGQKENQIFALEEPESHSHFEYQKQFFQEIRKFAENNQIFVSTHSPVFVDRADPQFTWIVRLTDEGTTAQRVAELKNPLDEIGATPSDILFSANRIVFVERESDVVAVRALAKLMNKDLTDVLIVPVNGKEGKSHLDAWVRITRGVMPTYLIVGSNGGSETERLAKDDKVLQSMSHVWKLGAIEEYYPPAILREALYNIEKRYRVDIDPKKLMKQIEKGEIKPSQINIGEKENVLGRAWRVVLAEQVAELLPKGRAELQDEISIVLNEAIP